MFQIFPKSGFMKLNIFLLFILLCISTGCRRNPTTKSDWPEVPSNPALESLYFDTSILNSLTLKIETGDFGKISSFVIVFKGNLEYEKYFNGHSNTDLFEIKSVTKSFSSALIGIAVKDGFIDDIKIPILDFFPEYTKYDNMSNRKMQITLEHVLQMQAGFKWDEWSVSYLSPENPVHVMMQSDDWLKYVLDLPVTSEPGTAFAYNTGASMLLAGVIKNRTGRSPKEFADEKLFGPLGIEQYEWPTYSNGLNPTGFGLKMRSVDMAKFGMLFLNDGIINGDTILTKDWISRSIDDYASMPNGFWYGYQWWLAPTDGRIPQKYVPLAAGWGIQHIAFIKSLGMVIVITGEDWEQNHWPIKDILYNYIFPAVKDSAGK